MLDTHPRYFKNVETGNVYKFTDGTTGCLHIVNDGVSRFPSDYAPRKLHTHTDPTTWTEVLSNGESLYSSEEVK